VKFHPKKMIIATVSDDKSWKMWAFPSGELIMSGEGHKDWIADCDFHPRYVARTTTNNLWTINNGVAEARTWQQRRGMGLLSCGISAKV
jgi:WD40 repeat protein